MIGEKVLSELVNKNLRRFLIESTNLPTKISGSHQATGKVSTVCDEFHGFQLKGVGDMNGIISQKLEELHNQGFNVWVTDVQVTPNLESKSVKWNVTIDKSSDGDYWNGFTSRGAGCNNNIQTRWNSKEVGQSENDIINKIISTGICEKVSKIELVKKVEFTDLGEFSFVQGFYRYKCPEKQSLIDKKQPENIKNDDKKIFDFDTWEF